MPPTVEAPFTNPLETAGRARNFGRLDAEDGRAALRCALRQLCFVYALNIASDRRDDAQWLESWLLDVFTPQVGSWPATGCTITGIRWSVGHEWNARDEILQPIFGFWHPDLIGSLQIWHGQRVVRETVRILECL